MRTVMNEFEHHQIKSEVHGDGFSTWLLRQPDTINLWCRVTAADRLLRVSGDFDPVVFAYGDYNPRSCVAWMGTHQIVDSYVLQKASIGTGRDAVLEACVERCRKDLRDIVEEARRFAPSDEEETQHARYAAQEALDSYNEYDGRAGVHELTVTFQDAYNDACGGGPYELPTRFGLKPARRLVLGHAAVRRLHLLLGEEK